MPKYLFACLHAPGAVCILEDKFQWETTQEIRWYYGNISSSSKVLTCSRIGAPISMIMWQTKRFNCHLGSYTLCAEGSLRMTCDLCNKFQVMSHQVNPHFKSQGCSMCLGKLNFIDTSLLVSLILCIKENFLSKINLPYRDHMVLSA